MKNEKLRNGFVSNLILGWMSCNGGNRNLHAYDPFLISYIHPLMDVAAR